MKADDLDYLESGGGEYLRHTDFEGSPFQRNRLGGIVRLLEHASSRPPSELKVLEIGCGTGNVCLPLASLGYDVKAIDIDADSIEILTARNTFANLTAEVLPMEEERIEDFDAVVLTEVLEHVPDAGSFLADLCRRLKDDSVLILTVPNGLGVSELFFRPAYWLKSRGRGYGLIRLVRRLLGTRELTTANFNTPHLHFFTLARLRRHFRENNIFPERFYRIFLLWTLLESLFSARWLPEAPARLDYSLSRRLPARLSSTWLFRLRKCASVPRTGPD